MSRPVKFFLVALVVSAVVTYGYLASRRKRKRKDTTTPPTPWDKLVWGTGIKAPEYFRYSDGTIDYSRKADGTPVPLGG